MTHKIIEKLSGRYSGAKRFGLHCIEAMMHIQISNKNFITVCISYNCVIDIKII